MDFAENADSPCNKEFHNTLSNAFFIKINSFDGKDFVFVLLNFLSYFE